MTDYELEEQFGRFVEFGKVFDKPTRAYLVQYLHARLKGQTPPGAELSQTGSKYYDYFRQSLDKLFDNPKLVAISQASDHLTGQILEDLLKWIRKTDKKIQEDNPHYTEKQKLDAWSHKPTFKWADSWYVLTNYLKEEYPREEFDLDFYVSKFKTLAPQAPTSVEEQRRWDAHPQKRPLDIVIDDLLAQWDALLSAKILEYEMQRLDEELEQFGDLLASKAEEYHKLMEIVTPFAVQAGRFWDLSRGLWRKASFGLLDKYRELLKHEKSLQELADLLGRMREAEIELEEETYENVVIRKEWVPDDSLRDEIVGTHGAADLRNMLPTEAALLAEGQTELAFYQRFADYNLQCFRFQGKKLVTSDEVEHYVRQKQKEKEKGPFVLCVDTSGSMEGAPTQIAKALSFAIMKMAAKDKRKCFLISFSIGIKTINLHDIANSMDKIVEFLSMSFDGGTDITPALSRSLEMLQTADYKDGDVLVVSDFVMFDIGQDIVERMKREQHKGTRFHSLIISDKSNSEILQHFDNVWQYDPEARDVMRQMLYDLKTMDGEG